MKIQPHHELSLIARNTLLSLSLLCSSTVLAEEVVTNQAAEAAPVTSEEVVAEKPAETAPIKSNQSSSVSIGYVSMSDSSVPGQEVSQRDTPIAFIYETDRYVLEVSIPYITRTAPSGKVAKSHHHESKKRESTTVAAPILTTSGLGDITSSLSYKLMDENESLLSLSAKGEIKLGTADVAVGLGTGVNDYFGELDAHKSFGDFNISAGLGYAVLGSPGEIEINDVKNPSTSTTSSSAHSVPTINSARASMWEWQWQRDKRLRQAARNNATFPSPCRTTSPRISPSISKPCAV